MKAMWNGKPCIKRQLQQKNSKGGVRTPFTFACIGRRHTERLGLFFYRWVHEVETRMAWVPGTTSTPGGGLWLRDQTPQKVVKCLSLGIGTNSTGGGR